MKKRKLVRNAWPRRTNCCIKKQRVPQAKWHMGASHPLPRTEKNGQRGGKRVQREEQGVNILGHGARGPDKHDRGAK